MRVRRSLAVLCTIAPLVWVTACSDSSAGPITGRRGADFSQTIFSPTQDKCHEFSAPGVDSVTNQTKIDIVLHMGTGCTDPAGHPSSYLPSTFSAQAVVRLGLWHSFSTVGWPPPVNPN